MITVFTEFFCLHRMNLLLNLVMRNFKAKYRGSILGYIWTLAIPFCQVLVFYFVYQVVLKVPIPNYLAFIVTGILPWVFFSTTINESLESLVSGQDLLTQLPMPLQAFPAASVATNFLSLMISVPIILGVLVWSGIVIDWKMLLFFPLSLAFFIFTYSLSFILAALFVIFRDIKYIVSILIQLWMYLTPILFSADLVPERFRWTLVVNPLSGYFVSIRDVLVYNQLPDPKLLLIFAAWCVGIFIVANVLRLTVGPRLVERL